MKEIIQQFYQSFQQLDAEGMVKCYHKEVVFEDPAFGRLEGVRAANMWRMLCDSQKGRDFAIKYTKVTEDSAYWEAFYTFSPTGRKVHNKIIAQFEFKEGLIVRHTDFFDLHRWAKQAMGFKGAILGWSEYFKKKLRQQTHRMLEKYEQRHS